MILHWLHGDVAEVQLRLRPIREQWEARGPGMLRHLQSMCSWLAFPPAINIHLVTPQKGGGGGRVLGTTDIEFVAVLANRWPHLPEVARLAWLITCAATQAGHHQGQALIGAVLAAAEHVEVATCDDATVATASREWLDGTDLLCDEDKLHAWWQTKGLAALPDQERWLSLLDAPGTP